MANIAQRWSQARPSKTFTFWLCVLVVIVTVTVGFTWGGWVTGGTSQLTAKAAADEAVVHRLAPICVAAAERDADRDKKLKQLKEASEWDRSDIVKKAGWATMPGETTPDDKIAEACAKVLAAK